MLTLAHRTIPPTANLDKLDPVIELDVVTAPRPEPSLDIAVSNSFGFGGQNAVVAFARS